MRSCSTTPRLGAGAIVWPDSTRTASGLNSSVQRPRVPFVIFSFSFAIRAARKDIMDRSSGWPTRRFGNSGTIHGS